jgi:hypothetical protein
MGQDVLSGTSFIGAAGDGVTIHFPRKNVTFFFNSPCNSDTESRSQKGGSLKDFEVCGVLEKEPSHNRQKTYQPVRHGHLPEVKRKFWHRRPIMLSTEVPDQHLSEPSVRLEAIKK